MELQVNCITVLQNTLKIEKARDCIRGPKTEAARLGMCLAEQMKREHEEQENDKYTGGEPV